MSTARRLAGAAVAVAITLATAGLSRAPVAFSGEDQAALRLSWRMEGVAVEECRVLSAEELARLPVHMRNPEACVGRMASYLLQVTVDGKDLVADTLRPHGARGDRPITVLLDLPLTPDRHEVQVTVTALLPEDTTPPADGLTSLAWSGPLEVDSRDVALLTLDGSGTALELKTP